MGKLPTLLIGYGDTGADMYCSNVFNRSNPLPRALQRTDSTVGILSTALLDGDNGNPVAAFILTCQEIADQCVSYHNREQALCCDQYEAILKQKKNSHPDWELGMLMGFMPHKAEALCFYTTGQHLLPFPRWQWD